MNQTSSTSLLCFFLLLLVGWNTATAQLKLAADNWPPFTSEKAGERIAVDLVEQALQRAGLPGQTRIVPWEDVLEGVKSGKYDAIVGAWKNPEREAYLAFSQPYFENRLTLVGRVDNKLDFRDVKQLESHTVGLVKGYAYGDRIANNDKIVKVASDSVEDSIKALLDKKVDFILTDSLVADAIDTQLPQQLSAQLIAYPVVVETQSLHFAVRKNHPQASAILQKFNEAVSQMVVDGTYNRLLGFDWLLADTNADGIDEYIVGTNVRELTTDPATSNSSYTLFAPELELEKKRAVRYRVLNEEYNTWGEAQQAITREVDSGTLTRDDIEDPVSFSIGRF